MMINSLTTQVTPTPRIAVNGIHLNVKMTIGRGTPFVMLHGFTGSSKDWSTHVPSFSSHFSVIRVDLLGHGGSDSPLEPARYRMEKAIADLLGVFDQLGFEQINLLGYSMGGRVALGFAVTHPERVNALVLESTSPGLADPNERRERIKSDDALADLIQQNGLEAFVDHWSQLPLFASQSRLSDASRAELRQRRLRNNVQGLVNNLRGLGIGVQPSYWDRLARLRMPTLLVVGDADRKYMSLAHQMAKSIPSAQMEIVADAGHAIHLEQPARFDQIVLDFLLAQEMASK